MSGIAIRQMAVLTAMPEGQAIVLDQLVEKSALPRPYVVDAVGKLILRGFVERHENGVYGLTRDGAEFIQSGETLKCGCQGERKKVKTARVGGLRQRMWNAMRFASGPEGRGTFSLPDILSAALHAGEETKGTYSNAGKYITALKKTGYLLTINRRQQGTKPGSNGFEVYRLDRNEGEKCPIHQTRKACVFDPNTGEFFPC